jgi:deaminated glutathione amidase
MSIFTAAAIQMTSGDDVAANIAALEPLVVRAVHGGATLITTPENVFYMRREGTVRVPDVVMEAHAGVVWVQAVAKQYGVWFLVGSIRAKVNDKVFNRSILIAPSGEIAATYDKIHLFDVTLPDETVYAESSQAAAGDHVVTAVMAEVTLGLSICYDLRFPYLYQKLAQQGATMLTVPSAFTRPTGVAHWHALLRARAIENACYVIAPAQCGVHPGGRETYGHSVIIDPWGTIVVEASGDAPEVILAVIDPAKVVQVRAQIPVLAHYRDI